MKTPLLLLLLGVLSTAAFADESRPAATPSCPVGCPVARQVCPPARVVAQSGKTANKDQAQPAPAKPATPPTDKQKPARPAPPEYLFL